MNLDIKKAYDAKDCELSNKLHLSKDTKEALEREENYYSKNNKLLIIFGSIQSNLNNIIFFLIFNYLKKNIESNIDLFPYLLVVIFINLSIISFSNSIIIYFYKNKLYKLIEYEYQREEWELQNNLIGEINEMVEIYTKIHKLAFSDAKIIVETMSKYPKVFLDTMFFEELGLLPPKNKFNIKNDCLKSIVFIYFSGLIQILPFIYSYYFNSDYDLNIISLIIGITNIYILSA